MMAAQRIPYAETGRLIERLPSVRGRYSENVSMAPFTWFRVGGVAEVVFRPSDVEDLAMFLAGKPEDVPVTVIGVTSNLLIRDGGIPGVVIRLGKAFAGVDFSEHTARIGAAVLDVNAAQAALREARAGLEFLSGIPGAIGGEGQCAPQDDQKHSENALADGDPSAREIGCFLPTESGPQEPRGHQCEGGEGG